MSQGMDNALSSLVGPAVITTPNVSAAAPQDIVAVASAGPSLPPSVDNPTLHGVWDIEVATANTIASRSFQLLHTLPGLSDRLSLWTNIVIEEVSISVPPVYQACLDLGFLIVPGEWYTADAALGNARIPVNNLFANAVTQKLFWRPNVTLNVSSEIALPWPDQWPVAASLNAPIPSLGRPGILMVARGAPNVTLAAGHIYIDVHVKVKASGMGFRTLY